jgi:hypothetical protein
LLGSEFEGFEKFKISLKKGLFQRAQTQKQNQKKCLFRPLKKAQKNTHENDLRKRPKTALFCFLFFCANALQRRLS